jgi:CRISPR-associated protein Cas6
MSEHAQEVVDVVFSVAGASLPENYPFALMRALAKNLSWLESDPDAGIHPVRGAPTTYGLMLLPRRAKLALRLQRRRVAEALSLSGRVLEIGSSVLNVGSGAVRALRPYGALYARLVATGCEQEEAFLSGVRARLAALATRCALVCGRRQRLQAGEREIVGFSLMVHDLTAEHSLLLQSVGLGVERKLGCGIFVPHRLAAAVGSA